MNNFLRTLVVFVLFFLLSLNLCGFKMNDEVVINDYQKKVVWDTSAERDNSEYVFQYDEWLGEEYQIAYAHFLATIWEKEREDTDNLPCESYSLYDINKDNVPELLIEYGTCEADYQTFVYSFCAGEIKEIGHFHSGHTVYYSWPGDNGIIVFWGHMGNEYIRRLTLLNDRLVAEVLSDKEVLTADNGVQYSDPQDFVDKAILIKRYYKGALLPIYEYKTVQEPNGSISFSQDSDVVKNFYDVLFNQKPFYAKSINLFGDAQGIMTMDQFLSPKTIYSYKNTKYEILNYSYLDINGDGQRELLLQLGNNDIMDVLAVLSYDNGFIYCYYNIYAKDYDFLENGIIYKNKYDEWEREKEYPQGISFNKSQVYTYYLDYSYIENSKPVIWTSIENFKGQ